MARRLVQPAELHPERPEAARPAVLADFRRGLEVRPGRLSAAAARRVRAQRQAAASEVTAARHSAAAEHWEQRGAQAGKAVAVRQAPVEPRASAVQPKAEPEEAAVPDVAGGRQPAAGSDAEVLLREAAVAPGVEAGEEPQPAAG